MLSKRSSERSVWLAFTLAFAGAALADEPRVLLERMNEALTTRNYDGVFSHMRGGKVEMLRIIHRVRDGEVRERLVSLDGSGREFVRNGNELVCYLPDKRTVLVERRSPESPLLGGLPRFDENSAAFYEIRELQRTKFNRRDTRVIAVTPRDEYRYGWKLWIDVSTAMPIRTQLCNSRGKVIEQIWFTDLKVTPHIPDSAFEPEVSTEGFQWVRNEVGPEDRRTNESSSLWAALKLPPGFRMTVQSSQVLPGSSEPVEHLVFTDGLASVSVFVESRRKSLPQEGQALPTEARVGSSSAFSTMVDDRRVTAIGEVPPANVRFIANSVKASLESTSRPSIRGPAVGMGEPRR
jgi:sigma-E factor negative regulatory protein RseB